MISVESDQALLVGSYQVLRKTLENPYATPGILLQNFSGYPEDSYILSSAIYNLSIDIDCSLVNSFLSLLQQCSVLQRMPAKALFNTEMNNEVFAASLAQQYLLYLYHQRSCTAFRL